MEEKEIVGVLDSVTVGVFEEPSEGVALAVPVIVGDVVWPMVELAEIVGVVVAVAVWVEVNEADGEMVGVLVEVGEMNGDGVAVAVPVMVVEYDGVVVAAAQTARANAKAHEKRVSECMLAWGKRNTGRGAKGKRKTEGRVSVWGMSLYTDVGNVRMRGEPDGLA